MCVFNFSFYLAITVSHQRNHRKGPAIEGFEALFVSVSERPQKAAVKADNMFSNTCSAAHARHDKADLGICMEKMYT